MSAPRLSGWCSPYCGNRSHQTCQTRLDLGLIERCDCPNHPPPTTDKAA